VPLHAATTSAAAAASAVNPTARVLLMDILLVEQMSSDRRHQPDRTRARADITQRQIPRLYERTVRRDGEPGES
jgi:hypothetical protein